MPENIMFDDMKPGIYYGSVTFIYVICVIGGLFIKDLGLIFELVSAFSLSFLDFIWPGGFYLMALRL
jgi:hypothetical protein